jgi:hypothetical protein
MENKKFLSGLEQTDWYEFIHLIIKYSHEIALSIKVNIFYIILNFRKIVLFLFTVLMDGIDLAS